MDFKYEEGRPDSTHSGRLYQLKVADLHPTQSAVGLDEVNAKAESMCQKDRDELIAFLITRPVPVVLGNDDKFYVTDHHHLARAVWDMAHRKNAAAVDAGSARVVVEVVANWRVLKDYNFWKAMHDNAWVYLFDPTGGGPMQPAKLPAHVKDLRNDPYRGLAWYVRTHFGYEKGPADFAEFQWAQFFRNRMILDNRLLKNQIQDEDILLSTMKDEERQAIVEAAIHLATSPEAAGLPGYSGHGSRG